MKRLFIIIVALFPLMIWAQGTLSLLNKMHQVQKGETLQSIALQYNLNEDDILKANPEIKFKKLKKGTLLNIPEPQKVQTEEVAPVEQKLIRTSYDHLNVGVLLSFDENTHAGKLLTEFYRGILMAADSVKKEGLNIDIYAWDCEKTTQQINSLLNETNASSMNVIIGPSNQEQIPALAQFCKEHNIRLVVPFSNSQETEGYPQMFLATPNSTIDMQEAAEMIVQAYPTRNYVILNTNNADTKGSIFTETITKTLEKQGILARTLNINGDDFAYECALNQFRDNFIIPDNTSIQTLNIIRSKLDSFVKEESKYKICLMGYPEWQSYTNTLQNDFYRFDTYIYSNYYFSPFAENNIQYQQQFMQNFSTPVSLNYPRFAPFGFDLAYYFMHGLAKYGDLFENHLNEYKTTSLQSPFSFKREDENHGYMNRFIQLIHYTPTEQTELIQ